MGKNGDLRKRILVVKMGSDERPQTFHVEFLKDGCDELNPLTVGQGVSVDCWLNGREWTNQEGVVRPFVDLRAAGPVSIQQNQQAPQHQAPAGNGQYFN